MERPNHIAIAPSALATTLRQLTDRASSALRDRSVRGCAWYGAPDEVVVQAFLAGGALAAMQLLAGSLDQASLLATVDPSHAAPTAKLMLFAFTAIAVVPVAEELLFRGVLFATLRARTSTMVAATLSTIAFTGLHLAQLSIGPAAVLGTLSLGAIAMALRLRHAALAPAIALHCGNNFVACIAMAMA
jgi:membrane protease YdiL (CAAX protease family)